MIDKPKFKLVIETAQLMLAVGSFFYLIGYGYVKGKYLGYGIPFEFSRFPLFVLIAQGFLSFVVSYLTTPIAMIITSLIAITGYYYLSKKSNSKQTFTLYAIFSVLLTFAFGAITSFAAFNLSKTEMINYKSYFEGKDFKVDDPIINVIENQMTKTDTIKGFHLSMGTEYYYLYTASGIIGIANKNIDRINYIPINTLIDSTKSQ